MKRNTKLVGDISEANVMAALLEAGYSIAVPFGENQRYDLIAERDGMFLRVQVKTGRLRNGVILFNGYSSHSHRKGVSCRRYAGDVDLFGIYCRQNETVYLVPIADVRLKGSLRVVPTANAQREKIRWADQYRVGAASSKAVGPEGAGGVSLFGSPP